METTRAEYGLPRSSNYMAAVTGSHQSHVEAAASEGRASSPPEKQRRRAKTTPVGLQENAQVQMDEEMPVECCLYTVYWPHPMALFSPCEHDSSSVKALQNISKTFFERCFICQPVAELSSEERTRRWPRSIYNAWDPTKVRSQLTKSQHGVRAHGLSREDNMAESITHADLVLPTKEDNSTSKTYSFQGAAMRIMGKLSGAFYRQNASAPLLCMWGHDRNSFKHSVYPLLKPRSSEIKLRFLEIDLHQQQLRDSQCLGRAGVEVHIDDLGGWQHTQSNNPPEVSQTCSVYGKSIAKALLAADTLLKQERTAMKEEKLQDIRNKVFKTVESSLSRIFSYLLHSKVRQALREFHKSVYRAPKASDPRVFIVFELLQLNLSDDSCLDEKLMLHCFPSMKESASQGTTNSVCFALGQAPHCSDNLKDTPSGSLQPRRRSTDSISECSDGDPSKTCGTPFSYYEVEEEDLSDGTDGLDSKRESSFPDTTPSHPTEVHGTPNEQTNPDLLLLSKRSLLCVSSVVRMGVTLALSILSGVVGLLLMAVPNKSFPDVGSEERRQTASASSLGLVGLLNFILVIWFVKVITVKSRRHDDTSSFKFFCLVAISGYVAWMDYNAASSFIEFLLPPHSIWNPMRLQSWSAYLTLIIVTVYGCVAWLLVKSWKSAMVLEQLGERGSMSSLTRYSTSILLVVMTVASVLYMCMQDIRVSRLASVFFMPLISLFACLCILSAILGSYAKQLSKAIAEVNRLNNSSAEAQG